MNIVTFIIYKKEIQNLITSLYRNFYIHGTNLSAEESSVVREAMDHARSMTIGYVTLYSITGLSMILHPLTFKSTDLDQDDAFNHTEGPHRILPFKTWYPKWDTTKSPQYEIEYFVQATLTALEAWCVSCTDTFCVTLMIYAGCQFDLLGLALKNMNKNMKSDIGAHKKGTNASYPIQTLSLNNSTLPVIPEENEGKIRNNVSTSGRLKASDESTLQDKGWEDGYHVPPTVKSCMQVERETATYIKECIKHHQSVLVYVAEMNKCFSTLFFVLFMTASLLICLLGFQVIVKPPRGLMFVRVLLHWLCTVFELGFFCWYGSEVMHKSERVYQKAYDCAWQDLFSGAKQFIPVIIMRAQRPAAVRAGLFGNICLPTFGTLMKNAYSYLAILRQMHEGDGA
ncbi:odorant receptor coreceptor-like [Zootermopsis nevadensis]|nr:odorant receptor coreceptor-like [Zootermopsis nevadensis]